MFWIMAGIPAFRTSGIDTFSIDWFCAEVLHAQLIDVYNVEADSHNSLVDAAENMQLDLGLKGKEIEELQLEIEHLK
ncbi:hypothetical protein ACUODJ_49790, partial [Escherichia sp. HC-CC]